MILKNLVYQKAKEFNETIWKFLKKTQMDRSTADQLRRASLSIVLNIAEGSAKRSDKEFAKFLEISIASKVFIRTFSICP